MRPTGPCVGIAGIGVQEEACRGGQVRFGNQRKTKAPAPLLERAGRSRGVLSGSVNRRCVSSHPSRTSALSGRTCPAGLRCLPSLSACSASLRENGSASPGRGVISACHAVLKIPLNRTARRRAAAPETPRADFLRQAKSARLQSCHSTYKCRITSYAGDVSPEGECGKFLNSDGGLSARTLVRLSPCASFDRRSAESAVTFSIFSGEGREAGYSL